MYICNVMNYELYAFMRLCTQRVTLAFNKKL